MTDNAMPGRDANGRFAAGNPGRPFGSRNRVSARVVRAVLRDFERHQDELLPRMRRWFLPQYAQLIGRLLPRDPDARAAEAEALNGADAARVIAEMRAALDRLEAGEGSLAEVEAALLGDGGTPLSTSNNGGCFT